MGCQIVVDSDAKTLIEIGSRPEAKLSFGASDIEASARLAVGLRGVPHDPAVETGERGDLFDQIADGDLMTAAQIYGLRLVVAAGGGEDAFRAVVDVQKFA